MTQLESSAGVEAFIKRLEEESQTKFVTFSVDRHYNDKDWQPLSVNRVHWKWGGGSGMPSIAFTGIPFMFMGSKRLVCHQGKDLALSQKRKYFEEKAKKLLDDHSLANQKSRRPSTKKVGCPAAISISKIATFPKFKVHENTERCKKTASKILRLALERDPVVWRTHYAITHSNEHSGHANERNETAVHSVHPRKRVRTQDLRKKCVKLTKQLMENLNLIEDEHTLDELLQILSNIIKNVAPLSKPPHLETKRSKISSENLTESSQRCLGKIVSTHKKNVDAPPEGTKFFPS